MLISDKIAVQVFCDYAKAANIQDVVISPGSRNAPFILSFSQDPFFKCTTITDERSAGFIALGKAKKLNKPVVLVCTSGSAVLNYAPAIVEAYFQHIRLIVITADRPSYGLSIGASQCLNQVEVFKNYISASFYLDEKVNEIKAQSILADAFKKIEQPFSGPIHLNVAFEEPLYTMKVKDVKWIRKISKNVEQSSSAVEVNTLIGKWSTFNKKLILLLDGASFLESALLELVGKDKSVYVLAENLVKTSSVPLNYQIDRTINGIDLESNPSLKPDLIITVGRNLISRKIRQMLKAQTNTDCWSFNNPFKQDLFSLNATQIQTSFDSFLQELATQIKENTSSNFQENWKAIEQKRTVFFEELVPETSFSDLWSIHEIIKDLTQGDVFLANSTVIRYANLYRYNSAITFHGNRGVSGIDGCTSTAIGFASENKNSTYLITGDLGFIYDQHAFWNTIKPNLTVFVINNGMGDIFNIIDGPSGHNISINYFTSPHDVSIKHIAEQYKVEYHYANTKDGLKEVLIAIKGNDTLKIVEVDTSLRNNSQELKIVMKELAKL